MKLLILDGFNKEHEFQASIITYLQMIAQCKIVKLSEKNIAPCLGCFNCWTKSPGRCEQSDDIHEITQEILLSDVVILLTPIIFGGYSSQIKKVLDRQIPILLPFFTKLNKENHHKPRYTTYPKLAAIGFIDKNNPRKNKQAQIFRSLVRRNSLNFFTITKEEGEHVLVVENIVNLQTRVVALLEELT